MPKVKKLPRPAPPAPKVEPLPETLVAFAPSPFGPPGPRWVTLPNGQYGLVTDVLDEPPR